MRICEVTSGLHRYVARVRVGGLICQVAVESATVQQARALLTKAYGQDSVLSMLTVLDESDQPDKPVEIKPIKPKPSVMKTIKPKPSLLKKIKPMTPKQWNKKSANDLDKWVKKKTRVTKAQKKIQKDFSDLAHINRAI